MFTRSFVRLAALVAAASIVAGCSSGSDADGADGSAATQLQLRLVTSSAEEPCSAPPLTSDDPGSACDRTGTTTYELAESLGDVTPTSVTRDDQGTRQSVVVEFDTADTSTLSDITSKAIDKQLAILLNGKVVSAATVKAPITTGNVTLGFGTASETDQVASELSASTTS